jgi:hypothetical protein
MRNQKGNFTLNNHYIQYDVTEIRYKHLGNEILIKIKDNNSDWISIKWLLIPITLADVKYWVKEYLKSIKN